MILIQQTRQWTIIDLVSIHILFGGTEKGSCTPKIFAPDVHPDFNPRYIFEAFTSPPQSRPTRMALKVKIFLSSSGKSSNERNGSAASVSAPSRTSGRSLLSSASSSMASSSESSEEVEYLSAYESRGLFYQYIGAMSLGGVVSTYSFVAFSFVIPSSSWACDEAMLQQLTGS